ncbi:MAG: ATP-dependent zinc metalloprotease FtsH [Eubacteriales bacterium]|nr:ATP-dependent zinc metalloprotease FtsH [Eubacteriales bacterium]
MKPKKNNNKRSILIYCAIVVVLLLIINSLIMPSMFSNNVEDVSYNTFLEQLDKKNIDEVQVEDDEIYYSLKSEKGEAESSTDSSGNSQTSAANADDFARRLESIVGSTSTHKVYRTVRMDDSELVQRLYESGATFSQVKPPEANLWLMMLMSYGIPILLFVLVWRLMMRRMGGGGGAMSFGKANAKVYVKAQTGITFADVAGQDEAKESLTEIVDFLHNPQKYADIGATLPKGALLVGPPGTGKTLLAKAVAGEGNVPFFSISGSEFVEMFVGMGAAKVRDLFKQANEKAPCIVFIDEIDTIGKKRDGSGLGGNDEREQTLNQLLSEMDGFDGKKGVVILAATNRPETLDKALLRPGRFDRRIPVELPDLKGREAILRVHAKKIRMVDNIDFSLIARSTSGASGAELANIINEAALRAVRCRRMQVTQTDLEESVEVILAGQQRKGAVISQHEKEVIAYHEVGHAMVAALQKNSAPVHKITIIPRTSGALGYTMQVDEEERVLMTQEEAFNKIVTFTGGRAAEALMFDSITTGASNDIEQATRIARAMITRFGMSDKFGMVALESVNNPYLSADTSLSCSQETATQIDQEVIALVAQAYDKAIELLRSNMRRLNTISRFLLERETLTGEEFMELFNECEEEPKALETGDPETGTTEEPAEPASTETE